MHEPKHYPIIYVDEVEEVRLLFSKFFRLSTDNAELNIPSKLENIYNYDEFKHSGNKDLIASNYLLRKIVMMYQAEECRNFLYLNAAAFETEMRGWLLRANGDQIEPAGGSKAYQFGGAGLPPLQSALAVVQEQNDEEEDREESEDEPIGADDIDVGLTERSGKHKPKAPKDHPTISSLVRDQTILQSGSKSPSGKRENLRTDMGSKTPGLRGKSSLGKGAALPGQAERVDTRS